MKNLLFLLFIVSTNHSMSQVPMAMPPDANAFYNKAITVINPRIKNIVIQAAFILKNRQANGDSLSKALQNNPALKGMSNEDIEGITTLIMVQASKDADEDLKKMVLSMKSNNEVQPVANNNQSTNKTNESIEEINDRKQLMLQVIMHRKSKIAEEISLVLKKIPENKETIINNLK